MSIWILNYAVGKARVVWPRSGSDILTESTTISETKTPKKEETYILDDSNVAVGIYGSHRLRRYENELSAYRTSCSNDLKRSTNYLALSSGRRSMPCGGGDNGKVWPTIIFMLMSRLTLSMKTSLEDS